ncbi:phenylacetate--CoA ligase family protein [Rhodovulum sp. ES.010]|uniref:phenylacetate--CoA ligase family protein n=1 Tax=Rhodovulum sp. ES.010 TaxID=1882821 RepID=UPI0015881D94|nr:phenylacetate--CoA ligase family protein [Rhodovulum sp. ES.010]
MKKAGFSAQDIRSLDDLRRFPLIDKTLIQSNYDAFVADYTTKESLRYRTTGGSTGTPLTVYSDDDFFARDKANTEYYMRVFGLDIFSHRSVRIYGDKIDEDLVGQGTYWRVVDERKLVMSCYHVTRNTAPAYLAAIDGFAPRYIHTRPSSILPLAHAMAETGLALNTRLDAIFCDGEYLTDGQRQVIETAFGTRLVNTFGHTEGSAVGISCPHSNSLHFLPQVGVVEVLAADGTPLTAVGSKGEMVVTGFNNPVFPFIRYRTGDVVVRGAPGCACGRNYTMISDIEGRIQDYVVDLNGNLVPLAPAIFNYNDMEWKGIREFKVIQDKPGALRLSVQVEPGTDGQERCRYIQTHLGAILGSGFSLDVALVDDLPKTRIGKYRYLDQRLDLAGYFRDGQNDREDA